MAKRKKDLEIVPAPEPASEATPYVSELVELSRWYRLNKRAETARVRLNKQNESMVSYQFGYSTFITDKKERERLLKLSQDAFARYENGEPMGLPGGEAMDRATADILDATKPSIKGLEDAEKESRKAVEKIAAKLPGADWVAAIPGLSLYGYGCILGLLGDPRTTSSGQPTTPHGLRNYIGLAPKGSYYRGDDGEGAAQRPGNKLAVLYFKVGDGMLSVVRPHNNAYKTVMYAKLAEITKRPDETRVYDGKKVLVQFAKPENKTGASLYAIKLATRYAMSRWLTDLWRIWHGQPPRDIDLTEKRAA